MRASAHMEHEDKGERYQQWFRDSKMRSLRWLWTEYRMADKYIDLHEKEWFALQGKTESVFVTTGDEHDGEMRRR